MDYGMDLTGITEINDEFCDSVYEDRGDKGLKGASSRGELVKCNSARDAVAKASRGYRTLEVINKKYAKVSQGLPVLCGTAACIYPESVTETDPMDILKTCCCSDRVFAEDALMAYRVIQPARERYLKEYAEAMNLKTPVCDIPFGTDPVAFYREEASIMGHYKKVDAAPVTLEEDCFGMRTGERWPEGPFDPNAVFYIKVTYDRIATWERENGKKFFGSMDPPWGTYVLFFTEAQLTEAIRYATLHGRDSNVNPDVADQVLATAGDVCPFCGRRVEDCGPLSARHFLRHGSGARLFYHASEFITDARQVAPMCAECAALWPAEWDRISRSDRALSVLAMPFPWTVENAGLMAGLYQKASDFCKKAVPGSKRPVFLLDGPVDLDAYLEYADPGQGMDDGGDEAYGYQDVDALTGLEGMEPDPGDLDAVKEAKDQWDAGLALEALRQHFGPMVQALPALVPVGQAETCPESREEAWRRMSALGLYKSEMDKRAQQAAEQLMQYADAHRDAVMEAATAAACNRRLAARYAKCVRMVLDRHVDPDVLDKGLLDIPWRCYYAVVLLHKGDEEEDDFDCSLEHMLAREDGEKEGYAWSLDYMARAAGIDWLPGGHRYSLEELLQEAYDEDELFGDDDYDDNGEDEA